MEDLQQLIGDLTSGDEHKAEAAVRKISSCGEEALPELEILLASPDADTRWWATWALAGIKSPRTPQLLRERLHDQDIPVRQCAALALREQPDPAAIPDLISCLLEEDPTLVRLAGAALAAMGPEAVPHLLEMIKNSHLPARLEILRALAVIGDERAIPTLFEALDDESALVEHLASEGLAKLGIGMKFYKP
jgi:eukaryotic-like serine/threonine-protein kinase